MYEYVPRHRIVDVLKHVRNLLRQVEPINERERLSAERREIVAKYIISNLPRTGPHPTFKTVAEIVDAFLLTIGAAHELFGYDLEAIRQYDLRLNSGRTHIVESYVFERDKTIDVPLKLAPDSSFRSNALLGDLVSEWTTGVPIRALDQGSGDKPGPFYVHVGTEDSRGSSLPPGSLALVDSIDMTEALRPNPRFIYLLQFRNGYRCSRCIISHGKLQMLSSTRDYIRARSFDCPGEVRVAGRIRMFAHALPQPEFELHDKFRAGRYLADLTLPWERHTRDELFLDEYRRFQRSKEEEREIRELLINLLQSPLTKRTERRYRHPGASDPHISTLIQLTVLHFARYSDSLRTGGLSVREQERYSLSTITNARSVQELFSPTDALRGQRSEAVWNLGRREFIDWLPLLSFKFPKLSVRQDPVVRLSHTHDLAGLQPAITAGSWMILKPLERLPETTVDREKHAWSRPLYVLRRGVHFLTGYLEQDGTGYALLSRINGIPSKERFDLDELSSLHGVTGVAVPV